jgi:hypothetical protein
MCDVQMMVCSAADESTPGYYAPHGRRATWFQTAAAIRYHHGMTSLVRSQHPDDGGIEALRSRAAGLESAAGERLAELERTKLDLAAFEIRYRQQVGLLHEQLDDLERAILEAEQGELAAQRPADGDGRARSARAPQEQPARYTSDVVRRLFRDVAKAVHPDLAENEVARDRRHALMVEANRAYRLGDEERLRSILQAWENSPEAVRGDDADAVRLRLVRRIEQMERQLAILRTDMVALRESPLGKLKAMVDEAAGRGKDLVRDMTNRLKRDIMVARNRLDAIQSYPSDAQGPARSRPHAAERGHGVN